MKKTKKIEAVKIEAVKPVRTYVRVRSEDASCIKVVYTNTATPRYIPKESFKRMGVAIPRLGEGIKLRRYTNRRTTTWIPLHGSLRNWYGNW